MVWFLGLVSAWVGLVGLFSVWFLVLTWFPRFSLLSQYLVGVFRVLEGFLSLVTGTCQFGFGLCRFGFYLRVLQLFSYFLLYFSLFPGF